MALSSLTFKSTVNISINAQNNLTPTNLGPVQNSSNLSKVNSLGTAAADAAVGGADEVFSYIISIAGSGTATLDLTNQTDVLNVASVSLARVKDVQFQLLSTTDDTVNGTTCTSVTMGNNGSNDWVSQSHNGWFLTNTSNFDLPNGSLMRFSTPSATGNVVDSTHKIIKFTNNDSTNTAKIQPTICGGTA